MVLIVVQVVNALSSTLSFRASFIGEESTFAAKWQIPRAICPHFGMTISNKYLNCTTTWSYFAASGSDAGETRDTSAQSRSHIGAEQHAVWSVADRP
jgi:hypothetical protein